MVQQRGWKQKGMKRNMKCNQEHGLEYEQKNGLKQGPVCGMEDGLELGLKNGPEQSLRHGPKQSLEHGPTYSLRLKNCVAGKRFLGVCVVLALMLSFAFTACGNASEEESGADDGQNPVMNFIGEYGSYRATILVEAQGSDEAKFTVSWSSSAAENSEWVMSGSFDSEKLTVDYDNCVKTNYVYDENGDITSQEEQYTDGHGTIQFIDDKELALTWRDDQENVAEDITFTYTSYGSEE